LNGGAHGIVAETELLTSKVVITVLWRKEQVDLAELARLRWIEKWKRQRLADHFGIGHRTVRSYLRRINADPSLAGLKVKPHKIRGR
jgi:hypothetical protein